MMAYLTRPGFNGGGAVSNRNWYQKENHQKKLKKQKKKTTKILNSILVKNHKSFAKRIRF